MPGGARGQGSAAEKPGPRAWAPGALLRMELAVDASNSLSEPNPPQPD